MSDYQNIDNLIVKTEKILSEVAGVSVQKYGEDEIVGGILEGFKFVARKRWWPNLMLWFINLTLDGVTGIVTADFNPSIIKFGDIRAVYPADRNRPLPLLPGTINPMLVPSGSRPIYVEEYHGTPDRMFRIWPNTASIGLAVHARIIPSDTDLIDSSKTIPFNPDVLANYAAMSVSASDGANGGFTQLLQQKYNDFLKQESEIIDKQPIILDTALPMDLVDTWSTGPLP